MRGILMALVAVIFCFGCSITPAEQQCRKELEAKGEPLKAKTLAACVEKTKHSR